MDKSNLNNNMDDALEKQVKAIDLELCLLAKQQQALVARLHQLNQVQSEAGDRRTDADRRSGQDRRHRQKQREAQLASQSSGGSVGVTKGAAPRPPATRAGAGRRDKGNDRRQPISAHYHALNRELTTVIERNEALIAQWNQLTGNEGQHLDLSVASNGDAPPES